MARASVLHTEGYRFEPGYLHNFTNFKMKKSLLIRDKKRRELFKKYELRRLILKSLLCNEILNFTEKNCIRYLLNKMPKNSSSVRIRNRCILTGRGRGVIRKYRLSRIMLKKYSLLGYIPGIIKK